MMTSKLFSISALLTVLMPFGAHALNYKTDNFKNTEEMKRYKTQLMLYKAAFELVLGEKVKSSYIYSFKLGEGLEFML